jgi:hypothetical protein
MERTVGLERVRLPGWAWTVVAAAVLVLYVLTLENGTALAAAADTLHELVHDARHFVGVPCH